MNNADLKDTRILEAFDYIDPKYIAEVAESLKLRSVKSNTAAPEMTRRTPFKHWKQFVALAACLILLSAAFPAVVRFVSSISDFIAGWGSVTETSEENSDMFENERTVETTLEPTYLYGSYLNPIKNLEPLTDIDLTNISIIRNIHSGEVFGSGALVLSTLNNSYHSIRYLGTIEGYIVLWEETGADSAKNFSVAGYDFWSGQDFNIWIYGNDERVKIHEAYSSGTISENFVRTVYLRNNEFIYYYTGQVIYEKKVISQYDLQAINEAWTIKFGEGKIYTNDLDSTQLQFVDTFCYGWIGDNIVFHAPNVNYSGEAFLEYEYNGYPFFTIPKRFDIWVYNNGELYLMQEAYEKGLLSNEELAIISQRNQYCMYY